MRPTGSTDMDTCPVPDDLMERLLAATVSAVAEVGNQLPDEQRAALRGLLLPAGALAAFGAFAGRSVQSAGTDDGGRSRRRTHP